jgi:hypothetical protein
MAARRLHSREESCQIHSVNLLKYNDVLFLGLCVPCKLAPKFPFYIAAMLVRLLVYIRLDSIAVKLINIFLFC